MATKKFLNNDIDMTQVIITPNLTFVGSTADFIKILEQSKFPIGLYWWLALSTNRNANLWENHLLLRFL